MKMRWSVVVAGVVSAQVLVFSQGLVFGQTESSEREVAYDHARAPRVQSLTPEHGAVGLDPTVDEIRVTFDMPMSRSGYSFVGSGPDMPLSSAAPWWEDAYTCVMPVRLKPNQAYHLSLNSERFQNFKSVWQVSSVPKVWEFSTGGSSAVARSPAEQQKVNLASLDALCDAMRRRYSYFDTRGVDWEKVFSEHRRDIVESATTEKWLLRTAGMLNVSRDLHLSLKYEGQVAPAFTRGVSPNVHWASIRKVLPTVSAVNGQVALGVSADGIGYVLIKSWDSAYRSELRAVQDFLARTHDAKVMILDVRFNRGGSESLAKEVAAWFVTEPRVYATHAYRRGTGPDDFTPVRKRVIEPNPPEKRFSGPVVVLMGRANISSCEAFLLMMKQAPNATLMGERSYGSSGNPQPIYLPNGVKLMLPSWKSMTPDGVMIEGVGIEPDVIFEGHDVQWSLEDPILDVALEHLRSGQVSNSSSGG